MRAGRAANVAVALVLAAPAVAHAQAVFNSPGSPSPLEADVVEETAPAPTVTRPPLRAPARPVPLPPSRPFDLRTAATAPRAPDVSPTGGISAERQAAGTAAGATKLAGLDVGSGPAREAATPDDTEGDETEFLPHATRPGGLRDTELPVPDMPGVFAVREAPIACLPDALRSALVEVAGRFGPVAVLSTHRGPGTFQPRRQRRASYHLSCRAADFRVRMAATRDVLAFLRARPDIGGIKVYFAGFLHIDDGPRRSW